MRTVKIILIVIFAVTASVFCAGQIRERFFVHDTAPVLSCPDEILEVSVSDGEDVFLRGVSASDAEDGDLTKDVVVGGISKLISAECAKVTLHVFDSDSNMATLTRKIRYTDYSRPRFKINSPLVYTLGETITLGDRLGATCVIDGDISDSIRISSVDVSSQLAGVYSITVQVTNSLGDTSQLKLPLTLLENGKKRDVELSSELIYLRVGDTFDPAEHVASTENVTVHGEVDTLEPGVYYVSYLAEDGSESKAVLTVVVE